VFLIVPASSIVLPSAIPWQTQTAIADPQPNVLKFVSTKVLISSFMTSPQSGGADADDAGAHPGFLMMVISTRKSTAWPCPSFL
jgi:hypothetical protein